MSTAPQQQRTGLDQELTAKDEADARRLRLAAMSGRVETGTLADHLFELNVFWQGGEMPQSVYEREEVSNLPGSRTSLYVHLIVAVLVQIIFHWGHVSALRSFAILLSYTQL